MSGLLWSLRSNVLASKASFAPCFYAFYMFSAVFSQSWGLFILVPIYYRIFTPRKDGTWQAFLPEVQDVTCMIGAVRIVAQGAGE